MTIVSLSPGFALGGVMPDDVGGSTKSDEGLDRRVEKELTRNIWFLQGAGFVAAAFMIIGGWIVYQDIKTSIPEQVLLIRDSVGATAPLDRDTTSGDTTDTRTGDASNQVLVFLIIRSAAAGAIAVTVLLTLGKISVASFDQAMRFTKRKLALLFLRYLFGMYDDRNREVHLPEIMAAFDHWTRTSESAFSSVKVQSASLALPRIQTPIGELPDKNKG